MFLPYCLNREERSSLFVYLTGELSRTVKLKQTYRETGMKIEEIIESKIMRINTTDRKLMYLMIKNGSEDGSHWCEISIEAFASATGKSPSSCSKVINHLVKHKLIAIRKVRLGSSYRNQFKTIPLEQDQ